MAFATGSLFLGSCRPTPDLSLKRLLLVSGILLLVKNLEVCESWHHQLDNRPVFIPTESQNVTVDIGDRAVLKCRVEQLGAKTVTWRRESEDHPLTIGLYVFAGDTRLAVDFNQRTDEWSLIVKDVQSSDQGLYRCQITTKDEPENTYDVQLNVRMIHVTGPQSVRLGGPIVLQCQAGGTDRSPDLVWLKDGERLTSDSTAGIVITKKTEKTPMVVRSSLTIQPSRLTHSGTYRCLGSTQDFSEIFVHVRNDTLMKSSLWHQAVVSAERMASPLHSSSSSVNRVEDLLLTFLSLLIGARLLLRSPTTFFLLSKTNKQ